MGAFASASVYPGLLSGWHEAGLDVRVMGITGQGAGDHSRSGGA